MVSETDTVYDLVRKQRTAKMPFEKEAETRKREKTGKGMIKELCVSK